jgi:A/G-specific adenine glycosylase
MKSTSQNEASALMKLTRARPAFTAALGRWYAANRRDLPWRRTKDPYRIWVSEIMLQQTRVAAVLDYYKRFLKQFPTVRALAASTEQDVLAAWSGLGYYRRARMMHAAAKEVIARGGRFPATAEALRELPGIGRYTSAAIASIAYGEKTAVVDGNVERVLLRLTGKHEGDVLDFWALANALIPADEPAAFNQAMMELGATVCTPRSPDCMKCPVRRFCAGRGEHAIAARPERKKAEVDYALIVRAAKVKLIQRNKEATLMAGMWELPSLPGQESAPVMLTRHSITTTDYDVRVHRVAAPGTGKWISLDDVEKLPLTGLTRKILRKANLIRG